MSWLDVTNVDSRKPTLRWVPLPPPPAPPPTRIEYHGGLTAFFGPADEFERWKTEPFWRRALGLTAYDRRVGNNIATGGGPR